MNIKTIVNRARPLLLAAVFLAACTNPFFERLLGIKEKSEAATYTVSFDATGGTPEPEPQTVAEGGTATKPADPLKGGYLLAGWYTEAALTNLWNFSTDTVTADMTLFAKWDPAYTVSFNATGGTPEPEPQTVAENGTATEPTAPTKAGHVFAGWYKEAPLINLWNFSTDTVTADITLFAKWVPAYTVTFNAHGGSSVPAQTVAENSTATEPTAPTKANLNFGGWYTEAALTSQWNFATDPVTADMTLYAKWTATVSFDATGGSSVPSQTVVENSTVAAPTAPTKANLSFGGWYTEAALTSQWNFATDPVTGDMTLYAKWTATGNFDATSGSSVPSQTVVENSTAAEPTAPIKADHVFVGWYTEAALTTEWNFATDTVTGDMTLYARWIPFKMILVPVPDGGIIFPTGMGDSGTATVDAAYEIGETEITYELWYTVRDWAESNGYEFYQNPGREGSSGTIQNTAPSEKKQEPVTWVRWFDTVVWLNALTEWVNAKSGSDLTPVYCYESACTNVARNSVYETNFVKEDSGHTFASAYVKPGANGFRLPTSNEWELAARWRNDSTNTVVNYSNPYFTKGNSASGATADYNNATATGVVAWYIGNSSGKTRAVKTRDDNALGLYDMSGNVWEWCYDWHDAGFLRVIRGDGWGDPAYYLQVGSVEGSTSNTPFNDVGFRPARTGDAQ
jgi:uncharacterized repeat protein (TIGR02543 family)